MNRRSLFVLLALLAISGAVVFGGPALARTIASSIQPIAQSDGTDITAASPLPVGLSIETGAGATTADTVRTVPATDGVQPVSDNAGSLTIDSPQLPASLGPQLPDSSLSVVQDQTGAWTVDVPQLPAILGPLAPSESLSVIQTQPNGPSVPSTLVVANQTANIAIFANPNRANLLVQSSGTTTCLVAIGTPSGGTRGVILAGGAVDDDGTGGLLTTESLEAVWIYDLSGAGTCKYRYIEEIW